MSGLDIESILTELTEIGAQASDRPIGPLEDGMTWESGHQILTLPESAAFEFLALSGRLGRQYPWVQHFSEGYIRDRPFPILRSIWEGDSESSRRQLDDLVAEVQTYSIERTVYIPVQGLVLAWDELEIGQVKFKNFDSDLFTLVQEQIWAINSSSDGAVHSHARVQSLRMQVEKHLAGKVCAVFRTIAEPIRAREQAEVETRRSLEVITFHNAAMYPFNLQADAALSIAGEVPSLGPWIALAATGQFNFSQRVARTSAPVEISAASIEKLDSGGAFALSDLLSKSEEDLTDLEQALLRAVHWFAASQVQVELENRLLNLITCLECLLGPEDGVRIATTVSDRTALIVARGEHREGVRKFVRDLYRARSGVSHGGAKKVADADVRELRWVAAELITMLVQQRRRVRTKKELLAWLDRLTASDDLVEPAAPLDLPRSIREWREKRDWSQLELAQSIDRAWVDEEAINRWENWNPPPDAAQLRYLANAIGVKPEMILLPPKQRWVVVRDHRFHLSAHRIGSGYWVARETGWDFADAVEWPMRAVDPEYPDVDSPTIIAEWRASDITSDRALASLARRIVAAMERALSSVRLPDDPPDWQPPELPAHWRRHLETLRNAPGG